MENEGGAANKKKKLQRLKEKKWYELPWLRSATVILVYIKIKLESFQYKKYIYLYIRVCWKICVALRVSSAYEWVYTHFAVFLYEWKEIKLK